MEIQINTNHINFQVKLLQTIKNNEVITQNILLCCIR
jgi:hypothetical protein